MIWLEHRSSVEETVRWECDGNSMMVRWGCHHLIHQHIIVIDCASKNDPNNICHLLLQCDIVTAHQEIESLSNRFDLRWPYVLFWTTERREVMLYSFQSRTFRDLQLLSLSLGTLPLQSQLFCKTTQTPSWHWKAQASHVEEQPHRWELRSQAWNLVELTSPATS